MQERSHDEPLAFFPMSDRGVVCRMRWLGEGYFDAEDYYFRAPGEPGRGVRLSAMPIHALILPRICSNVGLVP